MSDNIAPGERRELRSVVRGQFKVLRAEVKRRADEMKAEIETDLVARYREQDAAIYEAEREAARKIQDCVRELEQIGQALKESHPDLTVHTGGYGGRLGIAAMNHNRAQVHRALMASIPDRIGDAHLNLDREEIRLLRQLSEGALDGAEARGFLGEIPTVGELVPRARLREIEQQMGAES